MTLLLGNPIIFPVYFPQSIELNYIFKVKRSAILSNNFLFSAFQYLNSVLCDDWIQTLVSEAKTAQKPLPLFSHLFGHFFWCFLQHLAEVRFVNLHLKNCMEVKYFVEQSLHWISKKSSSAQSSSLSLNSVFDQFFRNSIFCSAQSLYLLHLFSSFS